MVLEGAKQVAHYGRRASSRSAVTSARESGFEERLRGKARDNRSLPRGAALVLPLHAAHLPLHVCVSLSKALATLGHHVRNGVDVDGLILVSDSPADIAEFHQDFRRNLSLDREIEGVHDVGPEMRVESFTGCCGDVVDTWEIRLWQSRAG